MPTNDTSRVLALRQTTTRREVEEAREVLRQQSAVLSKLATRVDGRFSRAVEALYSTEGHVVLSGMGKSGLIGRKIASTLASTGTPAIFVNAGEAHHGDMGMITSRDTAVLISRSGETAEVVQLLPHLRRLGVRIVAIVGELGSSLARQADVALDASVDGEVCPCNLAPTSSALAALALGDALAVALMRRRGLTSRDFARVHPGGRLGRRLATRVKDVMRSNHLPIVPPTASVGDSLIAITQGRLGLVLVMEDGELQGIVTDGDLRRGMQRHPADLLSMSISEIMTKDPVTTREDTMLADAFAQMQELKIKALVAVDVCGEVMGIVEVFDDK
ncbi:MAG: KpsF/GutQ family sugar-phosphate isomerase [Deltaproteobacteria bacterium]|nr:KpsF/GutQ family sugar-phosphate isomerase [Deltaproteobacteria bacterium]